MTSVQPTKPPLTLTIPERLNLIRNAREEAALQSLAGFCRWMWGVIEGDTSDGLDDVRELWGLLDAPNEGSQPEGGGAGSVVGTSDESVPGADTTAPNVARQPDHPPTRERAGKVLVWNWHLDLLCRELEWLARGYTDTGEKVDELYVNIPPGFLKSRLGSVMFPAFRWLLDPGLRLWCGSNDGDLSKRDNRYMRTLVMSQRYKDLQHRQARNKGLTVTETDGKVAITDAAGKDVTTDHTWTLARDQFEKVNYANTRGGERYCQAISGDLTGKNVMGKRCDGQVLDDPHEMAEVRSGHIGRNATNIRQALITRLNKGGWRLCIMQRLAVDDYTGQRIDLALVPGSRVRAVVLPARYDPDHPHAHPDDPRTERGEFLFPEWHGEREDTEMLSTLLERGYAAQYGQRPQEAGSGLFRREMFQQRYSVTPRQLVRAVRFRQAAISVDCNFKKGLRTDHVVFTVWGLLDANGATPQFKPGKYCLGRVRGRWSFTKTCTALRGSRTEWPMAGLVLVEEKANGAALIDVMREEGHPGVVPYNPKASKVARAEVSALALEACEVWFPRDEDAPWMESFTDEHVSFTGAPGREDDQVDSMSQMMIRWGILDDLVFDAFLHGLHVIEAHDIPQSWPRYCAMRFDWARPNCVLWGAVRPDGVLEVYRELYQHRQRASDLAAEVLAIADRTGRPCPAAACTDGANDYCQHCGGTGLVDREYVTTAWSGDDNPNEVAEIAAAGIPISTLPTQTRDTEAGTKAVNAKWTDAPPTLLIHDTCNNLLQEIPTYQRAPSGKPVKTDAGACDTLRWLVVGVDGQLGGVGGMNLALDDDALTQESPWRM